VLIRFTQAARKHKIGKARVLHVINHADLAFTTPGGDGKAERTVWLGADHEGRVLEVMTINIDDGLLVIHAMDIRAKYRDRYDSATNP
jgi:hypothetical protein